MRLVNRSALVSYPIRCNSIAGDHVDSISQKQILRFRTCRSTSAREERRQKEPPSARFRTMHLGNFWRSPRRAFSPRRRETRGEINPKLHPKISRIARFKERKKEKKKKKLHDIRCYPDVAPKLYELFELPRFSNSRKNRIRASYVCTHKRRKRRKKKNSPPRQMRRRTPLLFLLAHVRVVCVRSVTRS